MAGYLTFLNVVWKNIVVDIYIHVIHKWTVVWFTIFLQSLAYLLKALYEPLVVTRTYTDTGLIYMVTVEGER